MSILFADIYEAIQNLRIQKGVCEKDILSYIEDRVGGCLKASNFVKTVRTLQKLVDDGVLIKKGKRFAFSSEPSDEKQNDEDDKDECDDEKEEELDMSDDECDEGGNDSPEGEDDDDDDEDDDDEEDDDDDDDDDENDDEEDKDVCEANANSEKELSSKSDQNPEENNSANAVNKEDVIMGPKKTNIDISEKKTNNFGKGLKRHTSKEINEPKRLLSGETRKVMVQNGDIKKAETFAFCVRDFIDSLYRPNTDYQDDQEEQEEQKKANVPVNLLQENMDATEIEEIGKGKPKVSNKRRVSRKRNQSRGVYRSRSPIKKAKGEVFNSLKKDRSDEVCFWVANNQFLPEPMEADIDIDLEKDIDFSTEMDARRHRSPEDPLQTNNPGVHVNKNESSCNNQENKKLPPCYEGNNELSLKKKVQINSSQMDNNANNQNDWFRSDEGDREQENIKRSSSVEDEINARVEHDTSLCSCCDKTEINS